MDDVPTGFTLTPTTIFRNPSRLDADSYSPALPLAQDGANGAIRDLGAGLSSSRQGGSVLLEPMDHSGPGLLQHPRSPWITQCGPPSANTEEVVGSHGVSGHGSEIIDGSLKIANFDSAWDIMSFEPSLALTTLNDGQIIDRFNSIPGTEILSNGQGIISLGVFDEDPVILNFDHYLGSSNNGSSLGIENFGDGLEDMVSHDILGLENLDPCLDMATVDLSLAIPNFDDGWRIASFDENHNELNHLNSDSHSVAFPPFPTLGAINYCSPWPGLEGSLAGESLHVMGERNFSGVLHATEFGFVGPEAGLMMDSLQCNMSFSPHWLTQGTACGLPLSEQSEGVAERQSENTADLNTIFGADVNLVPCVADVEHEPKVGRKRNRHSASEWEEADKHIRRLYLDKGHTAEEVEFEMSVIHGFKAS
ncbi:hypothetical protein ACEPPN_007148 [Leptodophora sp. 'Broadleaf-Isolate-01']